jgi:hypothetical protein
MKFTRTVLEAVDRPAAAENPIASAGEPAP